MRCLVCGGEMRLTNVAQGRTMLVPGFEQRTLTCSGCGYTEHRLTFGHEERGIQILEVEAHSVLPAEPECPATREAWARAVEKLQLRRAALAQEAAAKRAVKAPVEKCAEIADEFDQLWESLAGHCSPPTHATLVPEREEPIHERDELPVVRQPGPATLQNYDHRCADDPRSAPAPALSAPPDPLEERRGPHGAWVHAIGRLRRRLKQARIANQGDTILRIDADALNMNPSKRRS